MASSPRRTSRPRLHIADPYPSFGLDRLHWRRPDAVVLRLVDKGMRGYRDRCPGDPAGRAAWARLADGLAPLGLGPGDIALCDPCVWGGHNHFLRFRFPGSLDWSSLPLVGEASWTWAAAGLDGFPGAPAGRWALPSRGYGDTPLQRDAARDAVENASTIVVDSPSLPSRLLHELAEIVAMRASDFRPPPLLLHFDGLRLGPVDPGSLEVARDLWRGHSRFMWSWMANSMPVFGSALKAAGRNGRSPMSSGWAFHTPFTVALLHEVAANPSPAVDGLERTGARLRAAGLSRNGMHEDEWHRFRWDTRFEGTRAMVAALGCAEWLQDGVSARFRMPGSGAHREWIGEPFSIGCGLSSSPPLPFQEAHSHPEFSAVAALDLFGLAGCDTDGRAALTGRGRRFLDLIGPDFADPDILTRWRGTEGQICAGEHVAAADRWISAAFRKGKRRLPKGAAKIVVGPRSWTVWNEEGTAPANQPREDDHVPGAFYKHTGRVLYVHPKDLAAAGFPMEAYAQALRDASESSVSGVVRAKDGRTWIWWGSIEPASGLKDVGVARPRTRADALSAEAEAAVAAVDPALLALDGMSSDSVGSHAWPEEAVVQGSPAA